MKQSSFINAFFAILIRDIKLIFRRASEIANPVIFFLIIVAIFPFGIGSEANVMSKISSGVLWISVLLATILAQDSLFRADYEDGTLEQICLCQYPLPVLVFAKIFVHWCATGLPLLAISPIIAVLLNLNLDTYKALVCSLALGTPSLSLIGAIGIALTIRVNRGGLLLASLILPLYTPVLIFGANAVYAASIGLPTAGYFYMLGSLALFALVVSPIATSAAIRVSLN